MNQSTRAARWGSTPSAGLGLGRELDLGCGLGLGRALGLAEGRKLAEGRGVAAGRGDSEGRSAGRGLGDAEAEGLWLAWGLASLKRLRSMVSRLRR
jgi:hypothetical protein